MAVITGCRSPSPPRAPVAATPAARPAPDAAAVTAGLAASQLGVAGTVLVTERFEEPCATGARVLLHVEGLLRPGEDDPDEALGALLWLDARTPRAGVPDCEAVQPYRGAAATLQPGARIVAFAASAKGDAGYHFDVRAAGLALTYAAPFVELPRVAEAMGPAPSAPAPAPSAPPRLQAQGDVLVDAATTLRWQRGSAPAPLHEGRAHEYCAQLVLGDRDDWRVPGVADVTSVGTALPGEPDAYYWTAGDDAGSAFVVMYSTGEVTSTHYDDPDPIGPYRVRCVSGFQPASWRVLRAITTRTPAPTGAAARRYPSGDVAALGDRTYWELGALASDATRGYYADGRLATERRGDTLHVFAPTGAALGTVALTDGPVALTTPELALAATMRGGRLHGPATIGTASRLVRGTYADGAVHGRWERLADGRVVATTTYRAGMRHGPATDVDRTGTWTAGYAHGYRDGVWRFAGGVSRSEGTFVAGTGVLRSWHGAQRTREEPYVRDVRHGTMTVTSPAGALELRIEYDHGVERDHVYITAAGERIEKTHDGERRFYASGAKRSERVREGDEERYTEWTETGEVAESGRYRAKARTGTWRTRRPDGRYAITEWLDGRLAAAPRLGS